MSTTSNSPADRAGAATRGRMLPLAALLLAAIAAPAVAERPLPARTAVAAQAAIVPQVAPQPRRVRIQAARMITLRAVDRRTQALLGAGPNDPTDERIIAVQVAEPFVGLTRTASPVIVIDGEPVDSFVSADARYVFARLPSATPRGGPSTVQVGWLGDLERTISQPTRLAPR